MAGASVGPDCNVGGGAFIESGATIGARVTVKNNVLLWDRVDVGDDVFLGPGVVFTNDLDPRAAHRKDPSEFLATFVRRGATIGANATIVCGVEIGEHAFVGAGAVVIADVPSHALVPGNPGRQAGWVCACGGRLDDGLRCVRCRRGHRRDGAGPGLRVASA